MAAFLTVSTSTLSGNSASNGGGIYNTGTLTVSSSTLSGNSGAATVRRRHLQHRHADRHQLHLQRQLCRQQAADDAAASTTPAR